MARKGYPSDRQDQYMLRFPDGMRDQLKAAAESNRRSMNAEMLDRLEQSFASWPRVWLPDEMMTRAQAADPGRRAGFEASLTDFAIDLFPRYFPVAERARHQVMEGFDYYLDTIPDIDRARIRAEFRELVEALLTREGLEKE